MSNKPTINTPPKGRTVAVVADVYRFLATGEDTNGRYALWEAIVPPGGGPPPHVHSREEEGFYVLDGEITLTVNGEKVVAGPGTFANMPVGSVHTFRNETGRPARLLISVTPAGLERMFFEVGVPLAEGAATAPPPTPDEIEKLLAVARGTGSRSGRRGTERGATMAKAPQPTDIDGYITQFPADVRAVLQDVREAIRRAVPKPRRRSATGCSPSGGTASSSTSLRGRSTSAVPADLRRPGRSKEPSPLRRAEGEPPVPTR